MHAQARERLRALANEADDIWECNQCGAHRPLGTKCCGRYMGLNDGCGTKVEQRRNVHAHPDADEDEVADFLQAHLARLDRERAAEPRVRAPTPGDDPSTDGDESDESDDDDSDDDHDPVTRTDLIRAVHLSFELAFEGMGHFVHPKKAEVTLGELTAAQATRARFNLIVHNKAPASKHYGAARISVSVPEFGMGNRDAEEGIGTRRGSYPTTIELAPLHAKRGELFNGANADITHPMMAKEGDSIKRFYLTLRPHRYGRTPGDLLIHVFDRVKIFDWVLKFLDYAPSRPEVHTGATNLGPIGINKEPDPNEKLPLVDRAISFRPSATTDIRTSPPAPAPAPPKARPLHTAVESEVPILDLRGNCHVCMKPTTKRCSACKLSFFCDAQCAKIAHERGHPAACRYHRALYKDPDALGSDSHSGDGRVAAVIIPGLVGAKRTDESELDVFRCVRFAVTFRKYVSPTSTIGIAICDRPSGGDAMVGLVHVGALDEGARVRETLTRLSALAGEMCANKRRVTEAPQPAPRHIFVLLSPIELPARDADSGEGVTAWYLQIETIEVKEGAGATLRQVRDRRVLDHEWACLRSKVLALFGVRKAFVAPDEPEFYLEAVPPWDALPADDLFPRATEDIIERALR